MSKKGISFKKYIIGFWSVMLLGIALAILMFILIARGSLGFMPSFEELENPKNILASEIISSDGKILDTYFLNENRSSVSYKNLPPNLIDALIATEDVRF